MSIESNTGNYQRTVTAFFDNRGAAEKARTDVIQLGIPSNMVSIVEGQGSTSGTAAGVTSGSTGMTGSTTGGQGFWESLKEMFLPDEDRHVYAEGLSRGGYLLSAHTDEAHYDRVLQILDTDGSVDMDQRETQWRSEGWSGYNRAGTAGTAGMASTAATEGLMGTRAGATTAGTSATGTRSTASTAATGTTASTASTYGEAGVAPVGRGTAATDGESLEVAEERLRVGKRDVNHGRVRLRSYVVETPVHESVQLRSENVNVSRRPVDRPLTAGDNAFRDRTIEAEEHAEEAVISKEARVVEEVSLNKTAANRTQEINDTVRRTEVEVDDGRTTGTAAGLTSGRATAGGFGAQIAEHMEVVGSDGVKVGTVDHLDAGDRIKLTKNDSSDGQHHFIPLSWVARVDGRVHLSKSGREALASRS